MDWSNPDIMIGWNDHLMMIVVLMGFNEIYILRFNGYLMVFYGDLIVIQLWWRKLNSNYWDLTIGNIDLPSSKVT